jgi:TRAP-type uncharacterized transport system fused permease subunit
MFTFYFGIIADITPPVALAAFAGSAIAKSNPFKTGVTASKLAIAAFIILYIFVFSPALLLIDTTPVMIVRMIITSVIGMIGIGAAMEGYFYTHANKLERIAFLAAGLMLVDPGLLTDIFGIGLMAILFVYQRSKARRKKAEAVI